MTDTGDSSDYSSPWTFMISPVVAATHCTQVAKISHFNVCWRPSNSALQRCESLNSFRHVNSQSFKTLEDTQNCFNAEINLINFSTWKGVKSCRRRCSCAVHIWSFVAFPSESVRVFFWHRAQCRGGKVSSHGFRFLSFSACLPSNRCCRTLMLRWTAQSN